MSKKSTLMWIILEKKISEILTFSNINSRNLEEGGGKPEVNTNIYILIAFIK